jgi:hypothetical protein
MLTSLYWVWRVLLVLVGVTDELYPSQPTPVIKRLPVPPPPPSADPDDGGVPGCQCGLCAPQQVPPPSDEGDPIDVDEVLEAPPTCGDAEGEPIDYAKEKAAEAILNEVGVPISREHVEWIMQSRQVLPTIQISTQNAAMAKVLKCWTENDRNSWLNDCKSRHPGAYHEIVRALTLVPAQNIYEQQAHGADWPAIQASIGSQARMAPKGQRVPSGIPQEAVNEVPQRRSALMDQQVELSSQDRAARVEQASQRAENALPGFRASVGMLTIDHIDRLRQCLPTVMVG